MALPDKTIDQRILNAAKEEFLEKGYMKASLRQICADAGVTTGALYNRYAGKDELFQAIVSPFMEKLNAMCVQVEEQDTVFAEDTDIEKIWQNPNESMPYLIDILYQNFDYFKLLICCAEGSCYENFFEDFVKNGTTGTFRVMKIAYEKGIAKYLPEEDELHVLLTAYYAAIFEPIRHNYSKEKAIQYGETISRLFNWRDVFGC